MRRRGAPTLYELTKNSGRGSISGGSGGLSGGSTPSISLLGNESARSVRVPVGFLWLLAVAVLGLAALSYAFGVNRGRSSGYADGISAQLTENNASAMARMVKDPFKETVQNSGASSVVVTPQKSLPSSSAPPNSVTSTNKLVQSDSKVDSKVDSKGVANSPKPTSNDADPREKGVNYLTLARPSVDQADKMLAFCRAEGLAAYLVSDNNTKLRKIIVLPGVRSAKALDTKEGQELLANVKSVGLRWKAVKKGNKDFSDAYLELFR